MKGRKEIKRQKENEGETKKIRKKIRNGKIEKRRDINRTRSEAKRQRESNQKRRKERGNISRNCYEK